MKGIKDRVKYQGVSLPVPLVEEIRKHVISDSKYKSIGEFVRDAVREKMERDNTPPSKTMGRLAQEDINKIVNSVVGTLAYGYQKVKKK